MKKKLENAYGTVLSSTLKAVNPLKKNIITTDCEVHIFIQENALDILKNNGYRKEYRFFKEFLPYINKGLVWADQDFKSYHHFYNPKKERGKFGYQDNALTVSKEYYNKALKAYEMNNYEKAMFYFGAASHIVQDLTIPQHAKGKLLDNHRQFEVYVKSNYKRIKRFKSSEAPIIFDSIDEYVHHNSMNALNTDFMYANVNDDSTRFYLTAIKCITLAQRSSAGLMINFCESLYHM
ncbi:MAG: zinc dependent phospholipase C family protein [Romboutsia sp.]